MLRWLNSMIANCAPRTESDWLSTESGDHDALNVDLTKAKWEYRGPEPINHNNITVRHYRLKLLERRGRRTIVA